MKQDEAKRIIQDCLENTYNSINFDRLIANILTTPYQIINNKVWEAYVREAFRDSISSYVVKGIYEDSSSKRIAILEVQLRSDTSLQHARTMQRNFVADFLKWGNNYGRQDGALVAFVWPEGHDWRFSLVKMEYSLEVKEGKIKTQENLTPAKRWSFLVGKNEKSHTAQSRFLPLVMEESHGAIFAEIENAFDVESVTDEFFEQYKECFFRFKDEIDRVIELNDRDRAHFESIGLDTANFAKKTLGQIAFLYFLQKKWWFGVASDKKWWEWPKDFLRKLFERREKYGKNFFNDVLEPLFYEALATDRWELAIYTRLNNTRVPFLNGGLFEPMKGYEWEKTDLTINDEVFSNNHKTKNGDIGDGIFDVFDRYNFTVSEDEPLEKEVAVDPEMLGKIFENLLEIRDRKSKWAFYTPRPIVHYMCQESLIEYLSNVDISIAREDIEFFIRESEVTLENDKTTKRKIEESKEKWREYRGDYVYKTPASIREKAKELDQALSDIRIADPAVGSGAFPLGMINEIVRARQILAVHAGAKITTYQLKLHAIQENIYGVDLEPGAVEICQLRLWLSLIVDETVPHPLPNLNYRIMQGNSLIEEYEWIKLYDSKLLSTEKPKKAEQSNIFSLEDSESNKLYTLLQVKLKRFIETSGRTEKNALKQEIDWLKFWLIEATLREQNKEEKISEIRRLREANIAPFFLWKLEFSEVFKEKGGFDVVIGNPPYVGTKGTTEDQKIWLEKEFWFADDLYSHFFFQGFKLCRENWAVTYITSKTYWTIQSKKNVRELLLDNNIIYIYDTENPFDTAMVDTSAILVQKTKHQHNKINFFKASKDYSRPIGSTVEKVIYEKAVNKVIFCPSEANLKIYHQYNGIVSKLMNEWWSKINTSKNIAKYWSELEEYRESIKPWDISLLWLLTDGGQGLATGNNGKYVWVVEHTKEAERIAETRKKKFLEVINSKKITEFGNNPEIIAEYFDSLGESDIRKLFDLFKEKYGRDVFGQGYLFRIVSKDEIKNISEMTSEEKKNWIREYRTFVPYDKGDKDGNRWYLRTPYYIDWREENVNLLKHDSNARYQGHQFYFRAGFCWSDIHTVLIKTRLKEQSIHDIKSMSMFSFSPKCTDKYLVALLNSTFISNYDFAFVNGTQTFQINDARQIPIIIPNDKQLINFENIFDRAYEVKIQQFDHQISDKIADEKLQEIQIELDKEVLDLYGLTDKEIGTVDT